MSQWTETRFSGVCVGVVLWRRPSCTGPTSLLLLGQTLGREATRSIREHVRGQTWATNRPAVQRATTSVPHVEGFLPGGKATQDRTRGEGQGRGNKALWHLGPGLRCQWTPARAERHCAPARGSQSDSHGGVPLESMGGGGPRRGPGRRMAQAGTSAVFPSAFPRTNPHEAAGSHGPTAWVPPESRSGEVSQH